MRSLLLVILWLAASPAMAAGGNQIVLIAGDDSLPVFDNAVARMQATLAAPGNSVHRLSTAAAVIAQPGVQSATLAHVLGAISALRPAPGQGCLVFATSHGAHHEGFWLSKADEFLTPTALDHALAAGCGKAPSVVVISSCYSGDFARQPMTRPNRVVLTAARADRSSFGCGAGRSYTVFDACLLQALNRVPTWRAAFETARHCVRVQERQEQETPSLPQAWFGAAAEEKIAFFEGSSPF